MYLSRAFLHSEKAASAVNIPTYPESIRPDEMKPKSNELALLENALLALEKVLAGAESAFQGAPYLGPTSNMPLEAVHIEASAQGQGLHASSAQAATTICLNSAAALIDVSVALMQRAGEKSTEELDREWHALITHTKIASRSAYRAALIMSAQMSVPGVLAAAPDTGLAPSLAH
jgi:hypothetical protein